jgi:hypothetical protein
MSDKTIMGTFVALVVVQSNVDIVGSVLIQKDIFSRVYNILSTFDGDNLVIFELLAEHNSI